MATREEDFCKGGISQEQKGTQVMTWMVNQAKEVGKPNLKGDMIVYMTIF